MNFFQQQDKAKSRTGLLVVLFIVAVLLVILGVYAVIMGVIMYNADGPSSFFNPELFFTIAGVTFAVICIGSMVKIAALSKGGGYVAEGLGGELINPATTDPDQRKLLNVVEEMAIASGVPVPPVYLLTGENSINAFAAGFSPNDAVIGVTTGCCQRLTREELQGVIAHEFSHILNGDMRLNIRLIGFLGGIMVIATIGSLILRGGGHRTYSSRRSGKGGGQIAIVALMLVAIGYGGVLIGRLIQSAVSRQREYLADASAVQFTRSNGIADALKKIGGWSEGSKIKSPAAGEACHMFFGKAINSLFATHPPLIERIQKIEPGFSGDFSAVGMQPKTAVAGGPQPFSSFQSGREISMTAENATERVGNITPENVAYSAAVLDAIPEPIRHEARDMLGASVIACALLLDKKPEKKEKQYHLLKQTAPSSFVKQLEIVDRYTEGLPVELRLPVLDIAVPALRQMSPEQFSDFKKYLQVLTEADQKITLFEFSLQAVIRHRLEAVFVNTAPKVLYKNISPLTEDIMALISILARAGNKKETVEKAFLAAVSALPIRGDNLNMPKNATLRTLHTALERLSQASSGVKKTVFDACCQSVLFDGRVAVGEAELLRAVAYAMDIPVPPFVNPEIPPSA